MHVQARVLLSSALAAFSGLSQAGPLQGASSPKSTLFPHISDNSHATPGLIKFFNGFYTAKSEHNIKRWLTFFNPIQVSYSDATLGVTFPNRSAVVIALNETVATWKPGYPAYPLVILGDTRSAIVYSIDTPGLFGAEIRQLSAFDFADGTVARTVDYWDGRNNSETNGRPPLSQYPIELGVNLVNDRANSGMVNLTTRLNNALAKGDAAAAASLFSYDGVLEDLTLRTRIDGELAISRYLQRAISQLPYGTKASVRHILGSARGGGYEWKTEGRGVLNGITALQLDDSYAITKLTVIWDGSRMSDADIKALAELSIEA